MSNRDPKPENRAETIDVLFTAHLKSLDPRERLAVLRRLPFCFGCGAQPGTGESCTCRSEA